MRQVIALSITKATLFPVRFLYTLDTGRIGRNEDAIEWYRGSAITWCRRQAAGDTTDSTRPLMPFFPTI